MDKSKIIRYIVMIVSVLTIAATAVPCQKIITESAKKTSVESVALMPTLYGCIVVLLAAGNFVLAVSKKYKHCVWTSLGCSVAIGIKLFLLMSESGVVHHEANKYDKLYEELGATNLDVTYDVITKVSVGFYILAGVAILVLITGFICFMVGSFRKTEEDY